MYWPVYSEERGTIKTWTTTLGSCVDEFCFKEDILCILFSVLSRYVQYYADLIILYCLIYDINNRCVALPAAQLLLEQPGLNPTERGNPVQVVRAIVSIVNQITFVF